MAVGREIRTKIKSIQNTQKITKAMQMVAASKMRKAQDRMHAARPYADRIRTVAAHLAYAHTEYRHPYLIERPVKRVGFIIVSSDRGLCGGLNTNLFREILRTAREWQAQNVGIDLVTIGNKANLFFRRFSGNILAQTAQIGDAPAVEELIGTVKVMLDAYTEQRIDRLFIARNQFVNTMTQRPEIVQLIPAIDDVGVDISKDFQWDYIYEPDSQELLDALFDRYIEARVYRSVVENIACEMSARMIAMKSASDNAGTLIGQLQLAYNKARQAAITQELSEIVGGAAAV